jgi:monoterpene epsilon-lactone hydrolase
VGGPGSYGRGMPSAELEVVNELLRSADFAVLTLEQQREMIEAGNGELPAGTTVEPVDAEGVPCEWVASSRADGSPTIVGLRGGGYCLGSLASNRRFCALLADVTGARVLNVGYRSAPEHPFPAALDDVLTAYRWLLQHRTDPATIVLAGNSAGGGLALATLLALRDAGDRGPAAAIALSPWTDLAGTGASRWSNAATEVMLDPVHLSDTAALYAGDDVLRDPYVSPLYGSLHDLPPLLLHVGDGEILRDDTTRFAARARAAGVDVTVEVVAGVPHVWHLFAGVMPEADDALVDLAIWLDERIP